MIIIAKITHMIVNTTSGQNSNSLISVEPPKWLLSTLELNLVPFSFPLLYLRQCACPLSDTHPRSLLPRANAVVLTHFFAVTSYALQSIHQSLFNFGVVLAQGGKVSLDLAASEPVVIFDSVHSFHELILHLIVLLYCCLCGKKFVLGILLRLLAAFALVHCLTAWTTLYGFVLGRGMNLAPLNKLALGGECVEKKFDFRKRERLSSKMLEFVLDFLQFAALLMVAGLRLCR